MKIFTPVGFAQLALLTLLPSAEAHVPACIDTVDPSVDYFPHKVSPSDSKFWEVEYFKTYKVAKNLAAGTTYVLYQCGSEPPVIPDVNATLKVPLESVGITVTPMISFMEQLGLLEKVDYYLTLEEYISSPCFAKQVEAGVVATVSSSRPTDGEPAADIGNAVVFGDGWQTDLPFEDTVLFNSYSEKTNKALFEWVKFYSLFFNEEERANTVTEDATARFECIGKIAAFETADAAKPRALWASYSEFCQGWETGSCAEGNYYCEFAELCETELITDGEGSLTETACGTIMTTEEFVEFGKDVEYWFYPERNWDKIYNNPEFTSLLDTMSSVQEMKVYDYQGSGRNAWFEERVSQYYDVLQDFCFTVGTAPALDRPNWFRNVLDEPIGNPGMCVAGENPRGLPFAFDGVCMAGTVVLDDSSSSSIASSIFALTLSALYLTLM